MNRCVCCGQSIPDDEPPCRGPSRADDWPLVLVDTEQHEPPTAWGRVTDWARRVRDRLVDVM